MQFSEITASEPLGTAALRQLNGTIMHIPTTNVVIAFLNNLQIYFTQNITLQLITFLVHLNT